MADGMKGGPDAGRIGDVAGNPDNGAAGSRGRHGTNTRAGMPGKAKDTIALGQQHMGDCKADSLGSPGYDSGFLFHRRILSGREGRQAAGIIITDLDRKENTNMAKRYRTDPVVAKTMDAQYGDGVCAYIGRALEEFYKE